MTVWQRALTVGAGGQGPAPSAAGRLLLDALKRNERHPRQLLLIAARLSLLPPPLIRPHHRRVARAMLNEAASRHEGQVFVLGCGDLALLCGPGAAEVVFPLLRRLLPDSGQDQEAQAAREEAVACWILPRDGPAAIAYAEAHVGEPPPPEAPLQEPLSRQTSYIERLISAADAVRVSDLLRRQTAIVLAGAGEEGERQVRPLFREVSFSIAALEARVGPGGGAQADPYLFRHLAARLDGRMLTLVDEAVGRSGPLDPARPGAPLLHLNLALETVQSAALAALARRIEAAGGRGLGVEISLMEAVADPAGLLQAAARLDALGCALAVGTVAPAALALADLAAFPPALVKIDWSAHLLRLPPSEANRLDNALERIGPAHVVLQKADSEAAIRWGIARRIRRFQGRHVDSMLAASRLGGCSHSEGCTLRQCSERHSTVGVAPRAFCRDHRLLDAAAPDAADALVPETRLRVAA